MMTALTFAGLLVGCAAEAEDGTTGTSDPTMVDPSDPSESTGDESSEDGPSSGDEEGSSSGGAGWDGERVSMLPPACTTAGSVQGGDCRSYCGNSTRCVGVRSRNDLSCDDSGVPWLEDDEFACSQAQGNILECTCAYDDPDAGTIALSECYDDLEDFTYPDYPGECDDWCSDHGLGACQWVEWVSTGWADGGDRTPCGDVRAIDRIAKAKPPADFLDGRHRWRFACDID